MARPRSIILSVARPMTTPAMRMERPECEPPPTSTMSVSPWTRRTCSNGTPSHSVTHLGEAGLVPLPARLGADDDVDLALGAHGHLGALARRRW